MSTTVDVLKHDVGKQLDNVAATKLTYLVLAIYQSYVTTCKMPDVRTHRLRCQLSYKSPRVSVDCNIENLERHKSPAEKGYL